MSNTKILVLAHIVKGGYIQTINGFIETLAENNALLLNHPELYQKYGHRGTQNYITNFIKENKINCIIYLPSAFEFYFDVYFFEKLRETCYIVMLAGEIETDYESRVQYYAQAMDLIFYSNFTSGPMMRQIGINSIPYWGWWNPEHYKKPDNMEKNLDVSFLGQSLHKSGRQSYIDYLIENGINVETFGAGSKNGKISTEEKIRLYKRTKINLNLSGVSKKTRLTGGREIHKRAKQFKINLFESAFCGGFLLSEYVPGIENLFEIGREIDVFHDKHELLEKIKYYLKHERERENIAKKGRERAYKEKKFNVKYAVPKLISDIDELKKEKKYRPSEIYLDDEFLKNYTTYRIWLILRFIKTGNWNLIPEELKIILKYRKLDWYQIRIFFIEEILDRFPKVKSFLKSVLESNKQ
ncbi:MAG: glycosyltransferase family 1 protein [Elusimicrobia bacterium]|nr:glycosyltransferase family 1 protein [Elusimicrobiota bacterium]